MDTIPAMQSVKQETSVCEKDFNYELHMEKMSRYKRKIIKQSQEK